MRLRTIARAHDFAYARAPRLSELIARLSATTNDQRLSFLDAHRGVAIALVVLFHAYARYPKLVPFDYEFTGIPVISKGWVGVQLFFIISGFVICMTLEKCRNFGDFITRRWLRLFPAMLVCSLWVFATAPLFPERPAGGPTLRDLLPGLTFVEPAWWEFALRSHQGMLEGAFWSLFVEMKFYFVFGALFFLLGGAKAAEALFGLFVASNAFVLAGKIPQLGVINFAALRQFCEAMSFDFFGWFAAGALFYRYHKNPDRKTLWIAVAAALVAAAADGGFDATKKVPCLSVVVFFTATMVSERMKTLLSNRVLLLMGFVSYPLYLLHENMMVAMIVRVGHLGPWMPHILMPLVPMILVIGLSWITATYWEPLLRRWIRPSGRPGDRQRSVGAPAAAAAPKETKQGWLTT